MHGAPEAYVEAWRRDPLFPNLSTRPHIPLARLARTMQTVHITDLAAERDPNDHDPRYVTLLKSAAARTMLLVPMLKEKELIGAIVIYGQEVNPLLRTSRLSWSKTLPAQAVIAIENTRLLSERRAPTISLNPYSNRQRLPTYSRSLEFTGRIGAGLSGHAGKCDSHLRREVWHAVHFATTRIPFAAAIGTPPELAEF